MSFLYSKNFLIEIPGTICASLYFYRFEFWPLTKQRINYEIDSNVKNKNNTSLKLSTQFASLFLLHPLCKHDQISYKGDVTLALNLLLILT